MEEHTEGVISKLQSGFHQQKVKRSLEFAHTSIQKIEQETLELKKRLEVIEHHNAALQSELVIQLFQVFFGIQLDKLCFSG